MALGAIKATPASALPIRNAALVSMGAPGKCRCASKIQDRPNMVDAWRLGEPLSESDSDVIDEVNDYTSTIKNTQS